MALRQRAHLLQVEVRGVHSRAVRRQRGKEREWQVERTHQLAKLRPVGPVPGDDRIEAAQLADEARRRVRDAQQIEAGGDDGAHRAGEPNQRHVGARGPDFQVVGPQAFERRQRNNEIADRPRADHEPAHVGFSIAKTGSPRPDLSTGLARSRPCNHIKTKRIKLEERMS